MRTSVIEADQRWRHFKGHLYDIVCIAVRESDQQRMVVYRDASCLGEGTIWTRPLSEFLGETIHSINRNPDGSLAVVFQDRFTLVPPTIIHKDTQEEP